MSKPVAAIPADSLLKVAADPDRVAQLYGIFREFCHEVRNELQKINLSLYIARPLTGGCISPWDEVEGRYRHLERLVDQFQTICRPLTIVPIRSELGGLIVERWAAWSAVLETGGRRLELDPPTDPPIGCFDPIRMTFALDALAAWRAEVGEVGSTVHLGWGGDAEELRITWREDGVAIMDPRDGASDRPATLALPLIARVLSVHGGALEVETRGDLAFILRWPSSASSGRDSSSRPSPL